MGRWTVGSRRGREQPWNDRVQDHLTGIREALQVHVCSAEGERGLFTEIDLPRPTLVRRVERLRRQYHNLVRQAEALAERVNGMAADFAEVRQQAAKLLAALRHHQAQEADLIFESFFTDIGSGD